MALEFDSAMLKRVTEAVRPGDTILTLSHGKPNLVVDVRRDGILVETNASADKASGPQPVPAWMIISAWEYLAQHGTLTQAHLLDALNVKRSAFVCALLARMKGVEVLSSRPVTIQLVSAGAGE